MEIAHLPFVLHAIIECLAGYSFVAKPQTQVSPLPPAARLVLECYGGLLIFSAMIALIFCGQPVNGSARWASAAFAFWHLWPSRRAAIRLQQGEPSSGAGLRAYTPTQKKSNGTESTLGGPVVHLAVHGILFVGFGLVAIFG